MQQFAVTAVAPRSIAWLIPPDDWAHVESIVTYNCALLGGYYNTLIPLTHERTISADYERFLIAYDPDLIVLAPDMHQDALEPVLDRCQRLDPLGVVPWDALSTIATRDVGLAGGGMNAPAPVYESSDLLAHDPQRRAVVAAADQSHPDTSRLALMACGDLAQPDVEAYRSGTDPRKAFLHGLISLAHIKGDAGPFTNEATGEIHRSPTREQLSQLVAPEHRFPLTDALQMLHACFALQLPAHLPDTLVGRTALYSTSRLDDRIPFSHPKLSSLSSRPARVVVLTSQHFGVEEATLFWNLRACQTFVAWLPIADLQQHATTIANWLPTPEGIGRYIFLNMTDMAFAAPSADLAHLSDVYANIAELLQDRYIGIWDSEPYWLFRSRGCVSFSDLLTTNGASNRPAVSRERVIVMYYESTHSFLPKPPDNAMGAYTVTLQSNDLVLPHHQALVPRLIAPHAAYTTTRRVDPPGIELRQRTFRTTDSHYLRAPIGGPNPRPLTFTLPGPDQIVNVMLTTNTRYTRLEPSSVANYHRHFIERAGGLEKAVYYLTTPPYSDLLFTLADNKPPQKRRPGWLVENPADRRVLRHVDLLAVVGTPVRERTEEYVQRDAARLPRQVNELLDKGLLERGFVLTCNSCQYQSWYPAEQVGQEFRCACCYQTQVYHSNPPWLYKLPEVVFRGFDQNMKVPLLALNHMKYQCYFKFSWVFDSNVYYQQSRKEKHRNLDIICLCDGLLYVGEAKSNDEIEEQQLAFYEDMMATVPVDGLIFATSDAQWNRNTASRISVLKHRWGEKIIELTAAELGASAKRTSEALESRQVVS